ncbi:MAG: 5'-nucleotidase C-terminal domain-containing protein [Bacteroidota bacterium]
MHHLLKKQFSGVLLIVVIHLISSCSSNLSISEIKTQQYPIKDSTIAGVDSILYNYIKPYHDSLDKIMSEVLVYSEQNIGKGSPESLIGNFTTDALLHQTNLKCDTMKIHSADFAFGNSGGLRMSLPTGEVTLGRAFELMPFENTILILEMNHEQLKNLFEYIVQRKGIPLAGIRMKISKNGYQDITINGMAYDSTKIYRVATNDYLANGGDGMMFLKEVKSKTDIGLKVRDSYIREMRGINQQGKKLKVVLDGRVTEIQ